MASKTVTTDATTPQVTIEKRSDGQYEARVRLQMNGGDSRVVLITPTELLTIGTATQRSNTLAWLTAAYAFAEAKDGFV